MPFGPLLRMARAWLGDPGAAARDTNASIEALVERGNLASPEVPEARREDWGRLLAALQKTADGEERTKARVEGLVRACTLFARRKRAAAQRQSRAERSPPGPVPMNPFDTVDRLPGFGPSARIALAEQGIRTVTDLVWSPPSAWDDLREP